MSRRIVLVTGGAGFIGSNIVGRLSENPALDVVVCDRLRDAASGKWRNIAKHPIADFVAPEQLFDWLAVVDFECTCDEPVNTEPREIIEFPCVLLNTRTLEVGAEFQVYLRPTQHPRLSAFCTRLTGITQEQVDAGVPLAAALEAHTAFLRAHGLLHGAGEAPRFAVATWSEWDCKVMLESETRWRRIQPPDHFRRHGSSLSASTMNIRDT